MIPWPEFWPALLQFMIFMGSVVGLAVSCVGFLIWISKR